MGKYKPVWVDAKFIRAKMRRRQNSFERLRAKKIRETQRLIRQDAELNLITEKEKELRDVSIKCDEVNNLLAILQKSIKGAKK